ncbi:MAG: glycosyltransferase family 2 protein [Clostridia bacterium]|nr:glycosyltransferase family 2 protein [Clostridia bacterium]
MSKVGVVIATYKREKELYNALESLAKQSYKDFCVVVVDDSADDVWNKKVEAIEKMVLKDFPDMQVSFIVNSENQGSAKSRNIGIEALDAEYITFLDDDDVYLENKIERQLKFMEDGGLDYTITDLMLYNESDRLIDKRIRNYITDFSVDKLRETHLKHHLTGTDTMMFKRDYLMKIGCFAPIDVGDEFYLMERAIDGEGKMGYLPGCDLKAYVHTGDGGLSSGESKIKGENDLFKYKQTFFDKIGKKTVRYIKMRHYAVLAFAEIRRHNFGAFLKNLILSFVAAPFQAIKLYLFER